MANNARHINAEMKSDIVIVIAAVANSISFSLIDTYSEPKQEAAVHSTLKNYVSSKMYPVTLELGAALKPHKVCNIISLFFKKMKSLTVTPVD